MEQPSIPDGNEPVDEKDLISCTRKPQCQKECFGDCDCAACFDVCLEREE